jgi:hypothetical protein
VSTEVGFVSTFISQEISHHLVHLGVNENSLTGTIPSELGNLGMLISLYLQFNTLNGTIPDELTRMTKLENLGLNANPISGSSPY